MTRTYITKLLSVILAVILTAGALTLADNSTVIVTDIGDSEPETQNTGDWRMLLVNPWNEIPDDFTVALKKLGSGQSVDERCYDDLTEMLDACRDAGYSPIICSSYRTWAKQKQLYRNKVSRLIAGGYSRSTAEIEAAKVVALPGTSEHQLGLAVDMVDRYNQNLDSSQAETKTQKWLMENSWQYGFILRYQEDKTEITGITYEPWHYRYVGREAAEYIYESDLCLEEYLEKINQA